jgi:cellulose synthase/poly-beta-1,6-N-acetylglucosamine synthase-like glycosyltransferase
MSAEDYTVVIPSYKRPEGCRDKTLAVLHEYRIPKEKIYVVVASKEQKDEYEAVLDPKTYHSILIGVPGLSDVRNWIFNHFPKGTPLVSCDDDLRSFIEFDETTKRHEKKLTSLQSVIKRGFSECKKAECRLWGVYPSPNGFFMKDTVTTDLRFIIGSFWGCFNPGNEIQLERSEKEDYERTIKFFIKDKAVVRLNFVSPKTAYYTEPGGMQTRNRLKPQHEAVKQLLKKYPQFVKINKTRKSGYPEIRLRDSIKQPSITRKKKSKLT